jgi:hypothetical membrane protein
MIVGVMQMVIRPGFDIRRHALSLLSNGHLGWIQIANFVITGALLIAGAVGLKRAFESGRGDREPAIATDLAGELVIGGKD